MKTGIIVDHFGKYVLLENAATFVFGSDLVLRQMLLEHHQKAPSHLPDGT